MTEAQILKQATVVQLKFRSGSRRSPSPPSGTVAAFVKWRHRLGLRLAIAVATAAEFRDYFLWMQLVDLWYNGSCFGCKLYCVKGQKKFLGQGNYLANSPLKLFAFKMVFFLLVALLSMGLPERCEQNLPALPHQTRSKDTVASPIQIYVLRTTGSFLRVAALPDQLISFYLFRSSFFTH